jgi:hypothetical protein
VNGGGHDGYLMGLNSIGERISQRIEWRRIQRLGTKVARFYGLLPLETQGSCKTASDVRSKNEGLLRHGWTWLLWRMAVNQRLASLIRSSIWPSSALRKLNPRLFHMLSDRYKASRPRKNSTYVRSRTCEMPRCPNAPADTDSPQGCMTG